MPSFPKSKSRPWIPKPKRDRLDSKGLKHLSRSSDDNVKFYNSKRWRSLRAYFIQMNPLCKACEENDWIVPGECVDHIIPIRFDGSMTALSNLQTLCNKCHAIKSGKESHMQR